MNEEEIKALQKQVKQIQKEYDILDGIIDIKDAVIAELKAENETLKSQLDFEVQKKEVYYQQTLDDEIKLNELYQVLQEIKKYIAKICKEECGYVQKKRCPDCDCRFGAILDLITKAEEE